MAEVEIGYSLTTLALTLGGNIDHASEWLASYGYEPLQGGPLRRGGAHVVMTPLLEEPWGDGRLSRWVFNTRCQGKRFERVAKKVPGAIVCHSLDEARRLVSEGHKETKLELHVGMVVDGAQTLGPDMLQAVLEWGNQMRDLYGEASLLLDTAHAQRCWVTNEPVPLLNNRGLIAELAASCLLSPYVHFQCRRDGSELPEFLAGGESRSVDMLLTMRRHMPEMHIVSENTPRHLGVKAMLCCPRALLTAQGAAVFQRRVLDEISRRLQA